MGRIGFYGKLPAFGDFLKRGLLDEFVDPWDEWLTRCIVDSQRRIGAQWLEVFLSSPIWRFALGPGVCGPRPVLGVVLPSADSVGRAFPFTAALVAERDDLPLSTAIGSRGWYEALETMVLEALDAEQAFDLEPFERKLSRHALGLRDASLTLAGDSRSGADPEPGVVLELSPDVSWSEGALLALDGAARATGHPLSFWCTEGSERVARTIVLHEGLPAPRRFDAMIAGRWAARDGWLAASAHVSGVESGPENADSPGGGAPVSSPGACAPATTTVSPPAVEEEAAAAGEGSAGAAATSAAGEAERLTEPTVEAEAAPGGNAAPASAGAGPVATPGSGQGAESGQEEASAAGGPDTEAGSGSTEVVALSGQQAGGVPACETESPGEAIPSEVSSDSSTDGEPAPVPGEPAAHAPTAADEPGAGS